ncbi:MAG: hypothetical protein ACE149_16150 [Armatimonadota bacterium]
MQASLRVPIAAVIIAVAVTTATPPESRASDAFSTIPAQAAAGAYLQEWSQFMWGLLARQTGTLPTWGDPVQNADGSSSWSFSAPDGTLGLLTAWPDGAVRVDIVLPDSSSETILQEPPTSSPDLSVTTILFHVASSDGFALDYTRVHDDRGTWWDSSDDWMQLSGTAVLPDGLTQSFTATVQDGTEQIESTQSDGSTFRMSVPLDPNEALPETLPDFTKAASGSYADATTALQFTLSATPKFPLRWAALLSDVEEGITGALSLNADFSARGQLEEDGMLAALVSWTRDGHVQAYDLTGRNVQMGPAGAALDFLRYRWQTLAALGAPTPGASGPYTRSRRLPRGPRPLRPYWGRRIHTAPSTCFSAEGRSGPCLR